MNKKIIIVGGMGPQASLTLHQRIIDAAVVHGAQDGKDFPHIIHISLPIDDFIDDHNKSARAENMIANALECLYLWRRRPRSYCL